MAMGRPKKLKEDRKIFSIYLNKSTLEAMDEYVHQRKGEDPGYSRSDFMNEAAEHYLAALKQRKK